MLERPTNAGVTLNIDKCTFRVPKIKFLGDVAGANGIEVDPEKVAAVVNLPAPKNVHEIRVFLGMVNHLGKFAEHLAEILCRRTTSGSGDHPNKKHLKKSNLFCS